MSEKHLDLILEEVGQFGKFQKIIYFLIVIPLALSATYKFGYVFTAGDLNYRWAFFYAEYPNNK